MRYIIKHTDKGYRGVNGDGHWTHDLEEAQLFKQPQNALKKIETNWKASKSWITHYKKKMSDTTDPEVLLELRDRLFAAEEYFIKLKQFADNCSVVKVALVESEVITDIPNK